jgi:uncharacterized protein YunC (DUF1805 family)
VDHYSAEIGVAQDTWDSGIISHINALAEKAGIKVGNTVQDAVIRILSVINLISFSQNKMRLESLNIERKESEIASKKQTQIQIGGKTITVTDSITFLDNSNTGDILVCGSHGGVSAGHYAQKFQLKAVFFNDAGIGKNNAGIKSLDSLSDAGILACTVDCMSAEIFNGCNTLENGIITVCNQLATNKKIKEKMTVKEAIRFI